MQTITLHEILKTIRMHRPLSAVHCRRYLQAFNIQPVGMRQRPQRYPADAPQKILAQLGLVPAGGGNLPSMKSLRKEKSR